MPLCFPPLFQNVYKPAFRWAPQLEFNCNPRWGESAGGTAHRTRRSQSQRSVRTWKQEAEAFMGTWRGRLWRERGGDGEEGWGEGWVLFGWPHIAASTTPGQAVDPDWNGLWSYSSQQNLSGGVWKTIGVCVKVLPGKKLLSCGSLTKQLYRILHSYHNRRYNLTMRDCHYACGGWGKRISTIYVS